MEPVDVAERFILDTCCRCGQPIFSDEAAAGTWRTPEEGADPQYIGRTCIPCLKKP